MIIKPQQTISKSPRKTLRDFCRLKVVIWFFFLIIFNSCSDKQPNVFLITLDTFRADRLAAYGNSKRLTPVIDALTAQAVVFENAQTPVGSTFSAHSSIFTSLYPREHRVLSNAGTLQSSFITLTENLGCAGYSTAAFVSMPSMLQRGGLDQGFQVVSDPQGSSTKLFRSGKETNKLARQWLELPSKGNKPIFMWLHYYEPHAPYLLTSYAIDQLEDYAGPLKNGISIKQFYAFNSKTLLENDKTNWALNVLYDGEIVEVDKLVQEMLTMLRAKGLLNNAIVIIAADHGQELGDHNQFGHSFMRWETVFKIPLLIWQSDYTHKPQKIKTRVSLLDLSPTILDLIGLPSMQEISGRTLAPLLKGGKLPEIVHYAGAFPSRQKEISLESTPVIVYKGKYKFIQVNHMEWLYDIEKDPNEIMPIQIQDNNTELLVQLRSLVSKHKAFKPLKAGKSVIPDHVVKELKALGYIQ